MHLLDTLNDKQQQAVKTTEGPVLIIAGAGSGKTRVLTHRIAYLVEEKKVNPENILAITFTNKAAKEMRERIEKILGGDSKGMWINTFHATCVRILRRESQHVGYASSFVVYDSDDSLSLIKEILKEFNLDDKKFPPRTIQANISSAKNNLLSVDAYEAENKENYFAQIVVRVFREYLKRLRSANAFDFDDLLSKTVELFENNPLVLKYYQNRFKYIHVDEYQDTNKVQYQLVTLLAQKHKNICVVGDPDQSIYGWRGADISIILDFEKDYANAMVINLEQNYRSTKAILSAANEVIKNNMGRKPKNLWTSKEDGHPLVYFLAPSDHDEARYVVGEIFKMVSTFGKKYNDFAILYRTNAQSRVFEQYFVDYGIPYKIIGGLRFMERKEIKDVLAYLRVLFNPADNIAVKRIINVPRRGIGPTSWDKLAEYALANEMPVYKAMEDATQVGITGKALKGIKDVLALFEYIKSQNLTSVTQITKLLLKNSGYLPELEAEKTPEARDRVDNVNEFLSITQEFEQSNEEPTLENFLVGMALVSDADAIDEGSVVTMMTMHTSKGLEYPVVFLIGMEENLFPHVRSILSEDELEEERRLCYVGITRAMERLYLTHAQQRMYFGRTMVNPPSRFLAEIPEELLPRPKKANKDMTYRTGHQNPIAEKTLVKKVIADFKAGDKVKHNKFGEGTVIQLSGSGDDVEVKVAFAGLGVKALILKYAPLEKV